MPISSKYKKVLQAMTKQYCKGKLDKKYSGVSTCQKAASVFFATMKKKGIKYSESSSWDEMRHIIDEYFNQPKPKIEESTPKDKEVDKGKLIDDFLIAKGIKKEEEKNA